MPQQTKTEALEELARLIRRDILNGTARLNETWWFDDDTKMQDRIAHVLLDYSDEEKRIANEGDAVRILQGIHAGERAIVTGAGPTDAIVRLKNGDTRAVSRSNIEVLS